MMPYAFTQNIKPTLKQQNEISRIFTPDYVIETSKVISIIHDQDSVIKVRDIQLKELQSKIFQLKKQYTEIISKIKIENNKGFEASKKLDSLYDRLINKSESKGVHLYLGVEVPKFNFQNPSFNAELMYEFKKFHVGIKGDFSDFNLNNKYIFNYSIKFRYKIF